MKPYLLSLPLFAVLAGCNSEAPAYKPQKVTAAPAVSVADLTPENTFPLKLGNQWTYSMETQAQSQRGTNTTKAELTFEVGRITPQGDGKLAQIRVLRDGKEVDRQNWLLNSKGLYQTTGRIGGADVAFTPPQPLVLFPAADNRAFDWKGKGVCPDGKSGTMKATSKVLDPIEVDTEVGRKSGIAVESRQEFQSSANKGRMEVTTWYAPKIGILRINQTTAVPRGAIVTTLRLTKVPG